MLLPCTRYCKHTKKLQIVLFTDKVKSLSVFHFSVWKFGKRPYPGVVGSDGEVCPKKVSPHLAEQHKYTVVVVKRKKRAERTAAIATFTKPAKYLRLLWREPGRR